MRNTKSEQAMRSEPREVTTSRKEATPRITERQIAPSSDADQLLVCVPTWYEAADVVSVESIEVVQPQQLAHGPAIGDFWTKRTLVELAEAQGVDVVVDVQTLQDESISDEEAEAFITALGL